MNVRLAAARAIGATLTFGLRDVLRRPAANLPGKIALYADPSLIGDLRSKLSRGSIAVVGTNGKTSTTNLLADALGCAGMSFICNRTGANLDSGVATALLQQPRADWGVFECDELWLSKVAPELEPDFVLLLNLFRDQLDRCGEIDRVQESVAAAVASSPATVLVYNGDDPLCAAVARSVPNRALAFGLDEDLGLAQNTVADAQMCQECEGMLSYEWRQYGQLGRYRCEQCGFSRPTLEWAARDVQLGPDGVELVVEGPDGQAAFRSGQPSPYAAYNLVAAWAAASMMGVPKGAFQDAVDAFDPRNGRLQAYEVRGRHALLNLAKNPTGFNQNLKIVEQGEGPKAVALFLNDREADGRDVSWIWDIDFEELAAQSDLLAFAGGTRAADMQVRLKYAGVSAQLVEGVEDALSAIEAAERAGTQPEGTKLYAIANYTALPAVHEALDRLAAEGGAKEDAAGPQAAAVPTAEGAHGSSAPAAEGGGEPVVIAHLFPELLNLYGDGGNVRVLEQRLRWRGIPVEVRRVSHGQPADLAEADLVFLGGGPDREQRLASGELMGMREELGAYIEADGPLLAICGGYQVLGSRWLLGDEAVEGLGIIPAETRRPGTSADRLVGDIALRSALASAPVVGYENHAGRTYLAESLEAFGMVASRTGHGNNDDSGADGARYRNVVGTYLHGPLLAKNPEVADWLLARALERHEQRTGSCSWELKPLDDQAELQANALMARRVGAS